LPVSCSQNVITASEKFARAGFARLIATLAAPNVDAGGIELPKNSLTFFDAKIKTYLQSEERTLKMHT
jgi:hypothetical protein